MRGQCPKYMRGALGLGAMPQHNLSGKALANNEKCPLVSVRTMPKYLLLSSKVNYFFFGGLYFTHFKVFVQQFIVLIDNLCAPDAGSCFATA